MQLNNILAGGVMTMITFTLAYPTTAQPVPPKASNACIQRTAEEMVVATRSVSVTGAGPVNAENGVRTLFMQNQNTGQKADCRVNTIDGTVLSVTLVSPNKPSKPPSLLSFINPCKQRVAEEMVVAVRDVAFVGAEPVDPENGVGTLLFRNRQTKQNAGCRVNTIDSTIQSVNLINR